MHSLRRINEADYTFTISKYYNDVYKIFVNLSCMDS
ncbi:hypothetical protein HNP24_001885 [Chryseobacterium sediminis]|uniref:Uncharacterized protein n=1 Tax=Chryseobacterium sediminis TaxID=1679494 RepID=A0ABR6PYZ2_9FLAO|nr:hypothetical protein [Chryseobacterium sediminis]